jgi:hypothetical protein
MEGGPTVGGNDVGLGVPCQYTVCIPFQPSLAQVQSSKIAEAITTAIPVTEWEDRRGI